MSEGDVWGCHDQIVPVVEQSSGALVMDRTWVGRGRPMQSVGLVEGGARTALLRRRKGRLVKRYGGQSGCTLPPRSLRKPSRAVSLSSSTPRPASLDVPPVPSRSSPLSAASAASSPSSNGWERPASATTALSRAVRSPAPPSPEAQAAMTRVVCPPAHALRRGPSGLALREIIMEVREQKRRRLTRTQGAGKKLEAVEVVEGPNFDEEGVAGLAPIIKWCLDDFPEFSCAICLDVLTHPCSLRACKHVFCRLCIFEMIRSCLHAGNVSPCCPLCRAEIERMTDLIKERALAEDIYAKFPSEVMAKVTSTHSLAKQKQVALEIKKLADAIIDAAEAAAAEEESMPHDLIGLDDDNDEDFLLLTIELVCLVYSIFIFIFLLWLRLSHYLV
jgi:hypothetical protein